MKRRDRRRTANISQLYGRRTDDRALTVPEIAAELGVSPQMVDEYLHRTIRKLWRDKAFRRRALLNAGIREKRIG